MAEDQKKPEPGLTDKQKQFVADWVKKKTGNQIRPCSVCGHTQWIVGDDTITPIVLGPGNSITLGGKIYPSVPFICGNCGNTHFLNAIIMGLPDGGKT